MTKHLQIIGHRGARGLSPENTLAGFRKAVQSGVDAIELDVVVSKDRQLVVSHEAWMNPAFCSKPDGTPVTEEEKEKYNLYRMTYEEIRSFDCGKRRHPEFPQQQTEAAFKPLLQEAIRSTDDFVRTNNLLLPRYHIELKSDGDGLYNPPPAEFAELFCDEIRKLSMNERLLVKSFDARLVQKVRKLIPEIKLALLVENHESLSWNRKELGFVPFMYCPEFILVNTALVDEVHRLNMQLVPWTVNEPEDIKRMIGLGVDGIISDYPDRLARLTIHS